MQESKIYDVIIIGGGPAGLTAGIYTSRDGFKTLILERALCGGLAAITDFIENYPGFPGGISGIELIENMKKQVLKFGAIIKELSSVDSVIKEEEVFKIKSGEKEYCAYSVIVATGNIPRKINIQGEDEFTGKGVSYCATCDGPLFRDKEVVVIGGGNAAVNEALFLTGFASNVTLVHRRDEFRAAKVMTDKLKEKSKIKLKLSYIPVSINGTKTVESITVKNVKNNKLEEIGTSGIFIFVGYTPNADFLKKTLEVNDSGYIVVNNGMETSVHGIFAAGDIVSKDVRQISTACGDGTVSAMSVRKYLKQLKK